MICFCCKKEKECIVIDKRNVCETCNHLPKENEDES